MIKTKKPKAIILDIEGTTTSIRYYPSLVGPYIRSNTDSYLKAHWNEEHVQAIIKDLRMHALPHPEKPKILDSKQATVEEVQKSAINHIEYLYKNNETTLALLYFQMYVWLDGQMKGVLKTHVFRDAAEMMYKWKFEDRIAIYIHSSARADVQMLMFACTDYGSLLNCIDGHFDNKVGSKTAQDTYHRISQSIHIPPPNIILLTDDTKDARFAKSAGFKVFLVKRERRIFSPIESSQFESINSFDKLKFID